MPTLQLDTPTFVDPYYSQTRHLPQLERCTTFSEAAKVAIDVLRVMQKRHSRAIVHQICGPITTGPGTREEKLLRFERVIAHQRLLGRVVFNQLPAEKVLEVIWLQWMAMPGRRENDYCFELLEDFYYPIFASGLVHKLCFISGWELSTGACWERQKAKELGLLIEDIPLHLE